MSAIKRFMKCNRGDAVVEATILFPIMIMIFAALVLLSIYLPQRAVLNNAAQLAATSIAKEFSDTGFNFDDRTLQESFDFNLHNTIFDTIGSLFGRDYEMRNNFWYRAFGWLFDSGSRYESRAQDIVEEALSRGLQIADEPVNVDFNLHRTILYTEIHVTVTQTVRFPVDLSFIGFPTEIAMEQTARAFVADGDRFLRGVDDAFAVAGIYDRTIGSLITFLSNVLGIN